MRWLYRLGVCASIMQPFEAVLRDGYRATHPVAPLIRLTLIGLLLAACAPVSAPLPTPTASVITTSELDGQPIEQVLPSFNPDAAEFLKFFMSTIPDHLPENAYTTWTAVNPRDTSPVSNTSVVAGPDGIVRLEFGIANPGSLTNTPNLLCLRNAVQVGCMPDGDVLHLDLPPHTVVLAPIQIAAQPGDQLFFLSMAEDDNQRFDFGSHFYEVNVDGPPAVPAQALDAPLQPPVTDGCNYAFFTKDPHSAVSPINMFNKKVVQRSTTLYLLLRLCEPVNDMYVRLILVADRTRVANPVDPYWQQPLHLTGSLNVIPLDTAQLGPMSEFQVMVMPLTQTTDPGFRNKVTQAILLSR